MIQLFLQRVSLLKARNRVAKNIKVKMIIYTQLIHDLHRLNSVFKTDNKFRNLKQRNSNILINEDRGGHIFLYKYSSSRRSELINMQVVQCFSFIR